ncbi:penicillin-binding protein 1B [Candidatus Thiothrix sp. Deng01]|uniref:Penicillin-binding protein 1B n=1 Tax=Candidatus Thiothrix phosphatis TaxID=3112415 RepID=A0ABU6CZX0_9GAMM|nr:penicillin-binding protein 1B [Candidatus Thiothrix sp. Deng01]MEB4591953.1 penicillin-binding protein 1B [Candidatus Thiothrix sp. Deng01]
MSQEVKQEALWRRFFKGLWFTVTLFGRVFRILLLVVLVLGLLAGIAYTMQLDEKVREQFNGRRWELPARVFARPLDMYEGQQLFADHLEQELKLLSYREVDEPTETGQYFRKGDKFVVNTRGFQFADDKEPARSIKVAVSGGKIASLAYADGKSPLDLMRLEPVLIGNFYPRHNEDRVLVRQKDVPDLLVKGLIAIEDKKFYEHQGVNPMAIIRALVANLKAGHTVQGGSTLTQQLVKNFYLTNERSWHRKIKEALMAFLLEIHYSKQEILEAYLNEIHLGQDGDRAIHGFGLAAQFYFNRPVWELKADQIALLIGLAKGAGYYDPRLHPDRALERRNLVLQVMRSGNVLTEQAYQEALAKPLGVVEKKPSGNSPFPAYLDLVRQQLQRDYKEEDLRSQGLMIFTAMDPIVQLTAETILQNRVARLEKANGIKKGKLNGAMIISSVQGGEVMALVGSRDVRYAGYNRALTAQRQIGSLVKPAIYLAALENSRKYTLATRINDGPVTVKLGSRKYWQPQNYDRRNMGAVTVLKALTQSRNTPAVRIGVDLGIDKVVQTLHDLGVQGNVPAYPAILLGAIELPPIDVQQMYQSLAAGGSYSPLKAIRSVMNLHGQLLTRYPLTVKQVASPEAADLLAYALYRNTIEGTAKELSTTLPNWKKVAGKTGTTNDKKDSWFAGFSGQHVVTVWVGRDDSKPTNMTGGTGALKVWSDLFRVLPTKPLQVANSSRLVWVDIDQSSGLRFNPACGKAVRMPFIKGSQPQKTSYCAPLEPVAPETPVITPTAPAPAPAPAGATVVPPKSSDPSSWIDNLMQ